MISAQIIRIKFLNEMTPEKMLKFHFDSSYGLINVYVGKRIPKSRYPKSDEHCFSWLGNASV